MASRNNPSMASLAGFTVVNGSVFAMPSSEHKTSIGVGKAVTLDDGGIAPVASVGATFDVGIDVIIRDSGSTPPARSDDVRGGISAAAVAVAAADKAVVAVASSTSALRPVVEADESMDCAPPPQLSAAAAAVVDAAYCDDKSP